jgi:hypothetical protein
MILAAKDIKTEEVAVPEWGGTVLVKALNGSERDRFEASIYETVGRVQVAKTENIRAKLVALTVVGEDLNALFTAGDIAALGAKSAAALDRVFAVAQRLAKITAEDVEELAKNSIADQADSSPTN